MEQNECYINLLGCAVSGRPFCASEPIDPEQLWAFAKKQSVRAVIASALPAGGILSDDPQNTEKWRNFMFRTIRKTLLFDEERKRLLRLLTENGIRCVPLKGVVLNPLYPKYGTREFSDNDIWIDASCLDKLEQLMADDGYELQRTSITVHYSFHKNPFFNFEFHHRLFSDEEQYQQINRFFQRVYDERLICSDTDGVYSMRPEDHYIFIVAHAHKHYTKYGLALRTLADIYLWRQKIVMDDAAVGAALEELGLSSFCRVLESLAAKVFDPEKAFCFADLSEKEREMLDEMLWLGNDGIPEESYRRRYADYQQKYGKLAGLYYYKNRLFPDIEPFRKSYPRLYSHKALRPLFYVYRPLRGMLLHGKRIRHEMKTITRINKNKTE